MLDRPLAKLDVTLNESLYNLGLLFTLNYARPNPDQDYGAEVMGIMHCFPAENPPQAAVDPQRCLCSKLCFQEPKCTFEGNFWQENSTEVNSLDLCTYLASAQWQ